MRSGILLVAALWLAAAPAIGTPVTVLRAEQFGARGDGHTDDGMAVTRMLEVAAEAGKPAHVQFAPHRTYLLRSGRDRYAFRLEGVKDLTLDGSGSLFLVDSGQRFLKITNSRNVMVRNFRVDYTPLPFADGTVVAKDKAAGTIDVRVDDGEALPPPGGPTHRDGEQAYFGALWHPGIYGPVGDGGPYWVRDNFDVQDVRETTPRSRAERLVRIQSTPGAGIFDAIQPGRWRFSIPVRGIAHRAGPGESVSLGQNHDLALDNIELWSAPWFAVGLSDNTGRVVLRHVCIRPRPGTTRNASSWRDGFHVKNNRASLLFEDCIVQGTGDDAFNIACHTSTVRAILSPTRIQISQNFPLGVAAMEPGDTLVFYSPSRGALLGRARITHADPTGGAGLPRAPLFTLDLDVRVAGLIAGQTLVWNADSANPHTVLRRCRMDTSCRFRSPVTLEGCRVNALAWFTGDEIESPIPSNVTVRDCVFRLGQGNPGIVIAMDGPVLDGHGPTEPVIADVLFDHNQIWGDFVLSDTRHVRLNGNVFGDAARHITLNDVADVHSAGNTQAGRPITGIHLGPGGG